MGSLMEKALEILEIKSQKALEVAKNELLMVKVENKKLQQALRYYGDNWDDTLHPGVVAVACEALGGKEKDLVPIQVCLLFLTAAVDVHDDVIDGSQMKNGKCTLFGKFGRDIALLIGDGMLLKGLSLLYNIKRKISDEKIHMVIETIENAFIKAGNAHAMELKFQGKKNLNPDKYFSLLKEKAAILEAHTRIGAIIGGGTLREIEILSEYGRILGTLITIRDEFIDIFEPIELLDRVKKGCLPLPMLYAFKNSQIKETVLKILAKPTISNKDIELLTDTVFEAKAVKAFKKRMENLAKRAIKSVSTLKYTTTLNLLIKASLEEL